ncbi:ABC transporter permease [Paenibacillus cymbidii]|uniref:ABC transporter permease n=1 Tax=Paenibacillus cymbidii TaxID=1639034 RepID=UPI001A9BD3E3|nr:ABC transporter permease subunit [Paenibacillus cymbidii]
MKRIASHKYLYLLGLPGMLFFIVFKYMPLYGILIAFEDYSPFLGVWKSEWIGLEHFRRLFVDPDFWLLLRNSFTISLLTLVLLFPAPIALALLLSELRWKVYKRVVQSVVYLPHFISWVLVASLTYLFLSSEQGLVNKIILHFGGESVKFLFDTRYFYPIVVLQSMWKEIGWGTIIYLAAIAGVDPALYEAARMDGAGKWRQIRHVTLPAIVPTIVILFLLNLGHMLEVNFEQLWLLQNPLNTRLSEVFDTYVYKIGILGANFSYSAAIGMFKSVVGLVLVLLSNAVVKRRGQEGIW